MDFLLEGSDAEITVCYLDGGAPDPAEVPEHDIAFLAVSQADGSAAPLTWAQAQLLRLIAEGRPILHLAFGEAGLKKTWMFGPRPPR